MEKKIDIKNFRKRLSEEPNFTVTLAVDFVVRLLDRIEEQEKVLGRVLIEKQKAIDTGDDDDDSYGCVFSALENCGNMAASALGKHERIPEQPE